MIKDIPSPKEFIDHGADYLNIAWDGVMSLLVQLHEIGDEDFADEFWEAAQRRLATSVLLTHQGTEFLLKGKIAEISAFLLITREPSQWPRRCGKRDVEFSDFRTVDAQDLIKIVNTASSSRLSPAFIRQYEAIRVLRNSIAHTIRRDLRIGAKEVLIAVLESTHEFFPGRNWFELRREWFEREAESVLTSDNDTVRSVLAKEAAIAVNELTSVNVSRYFGFAKGRRRYNCPHCVFSYEWDVLANAKTAILHPNTPKSNQILCFVCGKVTDVIRKNCGLRDCRGNVVWEEKELCLTCMNGEDE